MDPNTPERFKPLQMLELRFHASQTENRDAQRSTPSELTLQLIAYLAQDVSDAIQVPALDLQDIFLQRPAGSASRLELHKQRG